MSRYPSLKLAVQHSLITSVHQLYVRVTTEVELFREHIFRMTGLSVTHCGRIVVLSLQYCSLAA